jgi:glycosyltransferase involved in cell wall biosynthesis
MKVSVVIPVFNSSAIIRQLVHEIKNELHEYIVEIILVNDGSEDNSEEICEKIAKENQNIKFLSLRKNFGEHNAVMCGLNYATGAYIVIIDDDFQNPPREIIKLLRKAEEGFDVVYTKYKVKDHNLFRNIGSRFNNMIAGYLLDKPSQLYLSSFKVLSMDILKEVIKYKGPFPYIDGLILRSTNSLASIETEHFVRAKGKSNYTFRKLISLYMNMFFNFSIRPLRILTVLGIIAFCTGFFFSVIFIVNKFLNPHEPLGWTSLIVAILTLSGVQLIFLGLIGEYLGKQYLDQNKTPQWVIKKEIINE